MSTIDNVEKSRRSRVLLATGVALAAGGLVGGFLLLQPEEELSPAGQAAANLIEKFDRSMENDPRARSIREVEIVRGAVIHIGTNLRAREDEDNADEELALDLCNEMLAGAVNGNGLVIEVTGTLVTPGQVLSDGSRMRDDDSRNDMQLAYFGSDSVKVTIDMAAAGAEFDVNDGCSKSIWVED